MTRHGRIKSRVAMATLLDLHRQLSELEAEIGLNEHTQRAMWNAASLRRALMPLMHPADAEKCA